MSDRTKMLLKLLGFLAIAALLGYVMFRLFFGGAPTVQEVEEEETAATGGLTGADEAGERAAGEEAGNVTEDEGGLPEADTVASGGATVTTRLTNTDVLSPTITASGTLAYYDPADGRFYTITDDGEANPLSAAKFPDAENVIFTNDGDAAVIEFPDGSNVVYTFTSGKQVTLPSHWEDFSFSSDGASIASKSIGSDSSNRALVISSTDGTQTRVVAALGDNDDKVDVNLSPSGNVVAFSRTGSAQGFGRSEYYLIDDNGEAVGNLIVDGTNFSAIWSPDGGNILYSVADADNAYRPALWYADSAGDRKGDTRVNLGVETWVEKCVFAATSKLYCAVPQDMVDGAGSDHRMVSGTDDLYEIALPSGRRTLLGYAASGSAMSNLTLSTDGGTLYFQDQYGRINAMALR